MLITSLCKKCSSRISSHTKSDSGALNYIGRLQVEKEKYSTQFHRLATLWSNFSRLDCVVLLSEAKKYFRLRFGTFRQEIEKFVRFFDLFDFLWGNIFRLKSDLFCFEQIKSWIRLWASMYVNKLIKCRNLLFDVEFFKLIYERSCQLFMLFCLKIAVQCLSWTACEMRLSWKEKKRRNFFESRRVRRKKRKCLKA